MQTDNFFELLPEYERQMRSLIRQLTAPNRYDDRTKFIVSLLKAGNSEEALFEVLQLRSDLKTFLMTTREIFNGLLGSEAQTLQKYVELRRQVLEVIQEMSNESGGEIIADSAMRELDEINGYVDATIAYLDFEPVKGA